MIHFKKLTLDDMPLIRPFLRGSVGRTCDNTVGGIFMWRDFFQAEYAAQGGSLFFRILYLDGVRAYTVPLGGDTLKAISLLGRHCDELDEQLVFCTVTQPDLELLESLFKCFASPERDWFDYLYNASDLISLSGRRYNGQRNHINYFKRTFPDAVFEVIDGKNIGEVAQFYSRFTTMEHKDSPVFLEDQRKVYEIFDHYDEYALLGGAVRAGGRIVAFALGEIVGDTLFVHVEKADLTVRGAYQMIVKEFAAHFAEEGISYINREDDSGDMGLRESKLSYHPCRLIEKYTVLIQSGVDK